MARHKHAEVIHVWVEFDEKEMKGAWFTFPAEKAATSEANHVAEKVDREKAK